MSSDLTSLVVDLINRPLERGDEVFVFSSGNLRGKLHNAAITLSFPAETYRRSAWGWSDSPENCLVLTFVPRSRQPKEKQTWTRKPTTFSIPMWAIHKCVHLKKIVDGQWMLNISTNAERPEKSSPGSV
jgi:hypothetical protein